MNPMQKFRITLAVVWGIGCIAGIAYSQFKHIPVAVTAALLPAILVELSLYAGLAFEPVRERCARLGTRLPFWMAVSAVTPYLAYSLPAGVFHYRSFFLLLLLAAAVTWWFRLLPRNRAFDFAFLVLVAGVYLAKVFRQIYLPPVEGLRVDFLGQLMWIRLSLAAVLLFRPMEGLGFGFVPSRREWGIGVKYFALFMPVGIAMMYGLRFARFAPAPGWWWQAPVTFAGILWVVALSEEFFFRGLLQQWLGEWFGVTAGVVLASLAFGAVHLPFRGFPNWDFAALAAVAGLFYGRAFLKGNGIRAAMVTHALVVTTWRAFFH